MSSQQMRSSSQDPAPFEGAQLKKRGKSGIRTRNVYNIEYFEVVVQPHFNIFGPLPYHAF